MKIQWVNARGATLKKLAENGNLWVTDHLPETGSNRIEVWEAQAEKNASMYKLVGKWAKDHIYELPQATYARLELFSKTLQQMLDQPALVIHDADLLNGAVLDAMRLYAERGALVILVGDVTKIDMATRKYPGFHQRASYCVQVVDL
ncbi:MAG: hypothetical protein WC091_01335 [Sulfuricellaceae bacterium]